jgi:hypothetical protein
LGSAGIVPVLGEGFPYFANLAVRRADSTIQSSSPAAASPTCAMRYGGLEPDFPYPSRMHLRPQGTGARKPAPAAT